MYGFDPVNTYRTNSGVAINGMNTKATFQKDRPVIDPQKYARRQNTDCGGQTEFDMVVGNGVYATRSWNRDRLGRLVSPQQYHVWKPGENVASNGHGFYAYTDKPTWDAQVHGIIRAFGKVTYGSRGLIAEKAEIVAIHDKGTSLDKRILKGFAKLYDTMGGDNSMVANITFIVLGILLFMGGFSGAVTSLSATSGVLATLAVIAGGLLCWAAASYIVRTTLMTSSERKSFLASGSAYSLKKLYPNVQIYKTQKAMLKAYGLPNNYTKRVPSPDDDNFWDVKV